MESFLDTFYTTPAPSFVQVILAMITATVLGWALAATYHWTHQGFSDSRTYLQAMVLSCLVATIMIIAIGNNLARGLGILGALAIIRFRTPIRDPRDIIFLFASLAVGIAIGANQIPVACVGTAFFCSLTLLLSFAPLTSQRQYEGLLRLIVLPGTSQEQDILRALEPYTSAVEPVALREASQGELLEHCYHVRLTDPTCKDDLLADLRALRGVSEVSLVMQRSTIEV